MKKILFKYPTRQRFEWFKQTLETYYNLLSDEVPYSFVISCDTDDSEMNSDEARKFMMSYPHLKFAYGDNKTKIQAVNADMDVCKDWDIVVLVSDDMIPETPGFDIQIAEDMETYFPDNDGALHYDDGKFGGDRTATLSIMGRKLYDRFGYIYHPDYKSFYCDNEFTEICQGMGKIQYIDKVVIRHDWRSDGADALYRQNSQAGKVDEVTYNRRKAAGFPR